MTGVSYMIPFVAAGGILIALAFLFGGAEVNQKVFGGTFEGVEYPPVEDLSNLIVQAGYAGLLMKIGVVAFSMLVPILSGFIAYAMGDRPALVAGIVGGLIAVEIERRVPGRPGRRPARRRDRPVRSSGSRCRAGSPASCRWWSSRWSRP